MKVGAIAISDAATNVWPSGYNKGVGRDVTQSEQKI